MDSKGNLNSEVLSRMDQLDNKYESLINVIWESGAGCGDTQKLEKKHKKGKEDTSHNSLIPPL